MRPLVLIIDDDAALTDTLASAFELREIAVDRANTWDDGLARFEVCAHELVIADYNLPGSQNGLRLLAAARQHRPATNVILMSGVLSTRVDAILGESPLLDAYHPKTPQLFDALLEAATAVQGRADEPTDWVRVARAWLSGAEVSDDQVAELDEALRAEMGG